MEWKKFLVKFYNEKKDKNPDYKFKDAMKGAKGPYHRQLSGGGPVDVPLDDAVPAVGGGKKRKSKKQLSGGADEVLPPKKDEDPPPPVVGGKKSKSKRSSKRRRTSKKR